MNFASIKKVTASIAAFTVLISTVGVSSASADTSAESVNAEIAAVISQSTVATPAQTEQVQDENRGTGGSNPLVVERLRQEGVARRAELLRQEREAMQNLTKKESIVGGFDSRYNTQKLPEYIPDFKTIGDVQAELTAVVTQKEVTEKIQELATTLESSDFTTQFADIENSDKKSSIIVLDALNIVSGRENTQFKPNEVITRKEAIKISTLVSGKNIQPRKVSSVADIDDSDWSVPYVETLLDEDIIYLNSSDNLEGDKALTTDEAFALYLLTAGVCVDVNSEDFSFYNTFKKGKDVNVVITEYETDLEEDEKITREDFAELSVQVINALSVVADYAPTEQLNGDQYSASQVKDSASAVREEILNLFSQ